jgi:hypothetical protein
VPLVSLKLTTVPLVSMKELNKSQTVHVQTPMLKSSENVYHVIIDVITVTILLETVQFVLKIDP